MSACNRFAASALLVLCFATAARAGDELYLRWDNCYGDGGAYNKVFACDTNAGTEVLVGSFRLAATAAFSAIEIKVDLAIFDHTIPAWWSMWSGGCRSTSLSASFSPPATSVACLDPWTELGGAFGAFSESLQPSDIRLARMKAIVAVPAGLSVTAQAGQEIFAFQLRINHARTVGAGSCAGCSAPLCIGWGEGKFNNSQTSFLILGANTPENGSNVTWQTGAVATTIDPCPQPRSPNCMLGAFYMSCQSVTPARSSTWGSIKSLYR